MSEPATTYADFRSGQRGLEYVDTIYVEIRDRGAGDEIVGFFDVDDSSPEPEYIQAVRHALWPARDRRRQVIERLGSHRPARLVFCDAGMKSFHVHEKPFSETSSGLMDALAYGQMLERLGRAPAKRRAAKPPKYPETMTPYSVWHYGLDWSCKCRDLDYLEIRGGKIAAITEITGRLKSEQHLLASLRQIRDRWSLHQSMFRSLESMLGVPAYFVAHTNNLSAFHVFDSGFETVLAGCADDYADWLARITPPPAKRNSTSPLDDAQTEAIDQAGTGEPESLALW